MNKKLLLIAIIVVLIGVAAYALISLKNSTSPAIVANSPNSTSTVPTSSIEYMNNGYGFSFALPQDWKGYSIVTSTWEGYTVGARGDVPSVHGPMISIRNPKWTAQNPYQDVPIMVFTLAQWDSLSLNKFHIGAAPINPSKLGFNANYVFALPARYNYAFRAGWQEVENILKGNPLQSLPPVSFDSLPANSQILLCGGVPNGSTETVNATTRLFLNLPKDIYTNKDHNLVFKTTAGNATANWISNGGPYGEAYESNADCWSYYYEFDGAGKIDLSSKSAVSGQPDYLAHFIIVPSGS